MNGQQTALPQFPGVFVVLAICIAMGLSGCSSMITALKISQPLDTKVESITDRQQVIDLIGPPTQTETIGEIKVDFYVTEEDVTASKRADHFAFVTGVTFFLGEIVAIPLALFWDDSKTVLYEFRYSENDVLNSVTRTAFEEKLDSDAIIEQAKRAMIEELDRKLEKEAQREAERIAKMEVSKMRSAQGDVEAAIELGTLTGNLMHVQAMAEKGNMRAAYAVYEQLSLKSTTIFEAFRWLCKNANEGNGGSSSRSWLLA